MSFITSRPSSRLFNASCVAMAVTAMTASIRAGILNDFDTEFQLSGEEMGWAIGTAFWGFTLAMIFAGPLCDILGMKRLAYIGFFTHIVGITLTIFATGFWSLFAASLFVGIGNGMVEGYVNPLITAIYPEQKVKKINQVHLWFPVGLVIGGLISYFLDLVMVPLGVKMWQIKMSIIIFPVLIYGWLFFRLKFPLTERVAAGISTKEMFLACLHPLFLIMLFLMTFTSITEWGPNQWIERLLQSIASPILVLVWIGTIMAVGRAGAGPVLRKFFFRTTMDSCNSLLYRFIAFESSIRDITSFLSSYHFCSGNNLFLANYAWIRERVYSQNWCIRSGSNWWMGNVGCQFRTTAFG